MSNIYSGEEILIINEDLIVEKAIKNNPELIAAEKMALAYDAKSHKEYFLENPMAGLEYMGIEGTGINLNASMEKNIIISQKIPFPLKFIWKIGMVNAEADLYKNMYEMKKLEIINKSRIAFYELYKTQKYIEITKEVLEIIKQLSDIAFAKYNQGMVSQQDVAKMDIEKDMIENELIILLSQKEINIQKLRQITGDNAFLNQSFDMQEITIPVLKYQFEEIKEKALNFSPIIKMKQQQKNIAENMRNMAIADYFPDFNLQYKKQIEPYSDEYSLMIEAEIPLWFLNNQQSDISEKWEMAESVKKEYENELNNIILKAKEHFEIIKSNYASLDLLKNKIIPREESVLKSTITSYQSKRVEFMTLLDSERMLLNTKKEYYMRLIEYLMHFRMLEELTGKLN
jgi:outer membrane protein TolC